MTSSTPAPRASAAFDTAEDEQKREGDGRNGDGSAADAPDLAHDLHEL
jgi:hypothetical protein